MNAQNTTTTQLDKANQVLKDMAINVTTEDRNDAMKELDIKARSTVWGYLNGKGQDLDTAMKLIEFFQPRILERNRKLSRASAA